MKWASVAALTLVGALPMAQKPAVLDSFDSVNAWRAQPSDGVSLRISSDSGFRGRAMRLDFDFQGRGGYAVARRAFNFAVPANYEFSFHIRGNGTPNTLELKFVDPSGDNVWWSNQPNFEFPREWREVGGSASRRRPPIRMGSQWRHRLDLDFPGAHHLELDRRRSVRSPPGAVTDSSRTRRRR